ncbi:hypothetical protein EJ03DRAFT_99431 [Teratosphaeria nubilosa]|uniref:CID domain-containing protein n=1 Tax=Teratosphaeria nubilosa TaxID=161662 RepID=A0A6G1L8B5_9PEZI|nr:hypothetical protein EJ03DRAFT_99431 [Teratosphaeria nubilosa]
MEVDEVCERYIASQPGHRDTNEALVKNLFRSINICTRENVFSTTQAITAAMTAMDGILALSELLLNIAAAFKTATKRIDTTKPGYGNTGLGKIVNGKVQQPPHAAARRLHILFVINDVLIILQQQSDDRSRASAELLKLFVPSIVVLAAHADLPKSKPTIEILPHILALLNLWKDAGIFSETIVDSTLQRSLKAASGLTTFSNLSAQCQQEHATILSTIKRQESEQNLLLSHRHSLPADPTAPWHDLPAANGLYLKRTRGYPLKSYALPPGGFELPHGGQKPDAELLATVSTLKSEMLAQFTKFTPADEVQDVDALGNIIWKDAGRPTRNYWGFSYEGIPRMKAVARRAREGATGYADLPVPRAAPPVQPPMGLGYGGGGGGYQARGGRRGGYGGRGGRGGFGGGREWRG